MSAVHAYWAAGGDWPAHPGFSPALTPGGQRADARIGRAALVRAGVLAINVPGPLLRAGPGALAGVFAVIGLSNVLLPAGTHTSDWQVYVFGSCPGLGCALLGRRRRGTFPRVREQPRRRSRDVDRVARRAARGRVADPRRGDRRGRVRRSPSAGPGRRLDADEERHLEPLPVAVDVVEPELRAAIRAGSRRRAGDRTGLRPRAARRSPRRTRGAGAGSARPRARSSRTSRRARGDRGPPRRARACARARGGGWPSRTRRRRSARAPAAAGRGRARRARRAGRPRSARGPRRASSVREVEADAAQLGAVGAQHREHAAVASPEVEDAAGVARDVLEQDALALQAAGVLVRPPQIAVDMRSGGPLVIER